MLLERQRYRSTGLLSTTRRLLCVCCLCSLCAASWPCMGEHVVLGGVERCPVPCIFSRSFSPAAPPLQRGPLHVCWRSSASPPSQARPDDPAAPPAGCACAAQGPRGRSSPRVRLGTRTWGRTPSSLLPRPTLSSVLRGANPLPGSVEHYAQKRAVHGGALCALASTQCFLPLGQAAVAKKAPAPLKHQRKRGVFRGKRSAGVDRASDKHAGDVRGPKEALPVHERFENPHEKKQQH